MKGDSIIKKHSIKWKTSHVIFTKLANWTSWSWSWIGLSRITPQFQMNAKSPYRAISMCHCDRYFALAKVSKFTKHLPIHGVLPWLNHRWVDVDLVPHTYQLIMRRIWRFKCEAKIQIRPCAYWSSRWPQNQGRPWWSGESRGFCKTLSSSNGRWELSRGVWPRMASFEWDDWLEMAEFYVIAAKVVTWQSINDGESGHEMTRSPTAYAVSTLASQRVPGAELQIP